MLLESFLSFIHLITNVQYKDLILFWCHMKQFVCKGDNLCCLQIFVSSNTKQLAAMLQYILLDIEDIGYGLKEDLE